MFYFNPPFQKKFSFYTHSSCSSLGRISWKLKQYSKRVVFITNTLVHFNCFVWSCVEVCVQPFLPIPTSLKVIADVETIIDPGAYFEQVSSKDQKILPHKASVINGVLEVPKMF